MSWYDYPPYVSVAERKKKAEREVAKRRKAGQVISPVVLAGKKIATTFWGQAWCDHLESFSDYESRLPRGRTYVRNGAVIHLEIGPRSAKALVQGTELYEVTITIAALGAPRWTKIVGECSGKIDSLVELLQGKLSSGVMQVVTHRETGLFPAPKQITLKCTCPDHATMCKHVAAVLYGVGARLDEKPELLFVLREVDHLALLDAAATGARRAGGTGKASKPGKGKEIADADLGSVFGIELEGISSPVAPARASAAKKPAPSKKAASGNKPAPLPKSPPPKRKATAPARARRT